MNERHKIFRDKALGLILERGFRGMTMRDLATALDCDVANLYNYIPSKHAFLSGQLFEISARFHKGISEITASGLTVTDQIRQLIRLNIDLAVTYPLQIALLVNEWRNLHEADLQRFIKERTHYEEEVKKMVMVGIRNAEIRKMEPDTATHLLLASLRWLFVHTRENPAINRMRLEAEITAFVMHGFINVDSKASS